MENPVLSDMTVEELNASLLEYVPTISGVLLLFADVVWLPSLLFYIDLGRRNWLSLNYWNKRLKTSRTVW